jgi:hypothetical protein
MDTCIPPELSRIGGLNPGPYALHGNGIADYVLETPVCGATRNARMRLLHFENAFGDAYSSEYCMAAMLNQVLIMTRNLRSATDRLARLTGTADAACPISPVPMPARSTAAYTA